MIEFMKRVYKSIIVGQRCLNKDVIKTAIDVYRTSAGTKIVVLADDYGRKSSLCYRHFVRCKNRYRAAFNTNSLPAVDKYKEFLDHLNIVF